MSENGVMMQYFEWYLPNDQSLWKKAAHEAKSLAKSGITAVWLPPAYKGQAGINDVGYGVYDMYDLGEFDQKGGIPTKYGTKDEYLAAIKALQAAGIAVYADIVFNHRMGADGVEEVQAVEDSGSDRMKAVSGIESIEAWTKFTFPGRAGKYSKFTWNHTHFDGVDWDQCSKKTAIYNFAGDGWDKNVDGENRNYDYLMGADLCFANQEVRDELDRWGKWYLEMTGVDGFRLDAIKHIEFTFFNSWLTKLRKSTGKELFTVGEYWSPELSTLQNYLNACGSCMSLFDVPLHFRFFQACNSGGSFDMRHLFDGTLVQVNAQKAVTFVENHDTQAGQALQTVIADWFKPLAYASTLLRPQGYPCIFYGDYCGIPSHNVPAIKDTIDMLCEVRKKCMFGILHDYFDDSDIIGWTLEGDASHPASGMAVLISDGPGGAKDMYIGKHFAGKAFFDHSGKIPEEITINQDGIGHFLVSGGSLSVWVLR